MGMGVGRGVCLSVGEEEGEGLTPALRYSAWTMASIDYDREL